MVTVEVPQGLGYMEDAVESNRSAHSLFGPC